MINSAVVRAGLILGTAFLIAACGRGAADAEKIPLGQEGWGAGMQSGEAPAPTISGEARVALDSANIFFRARAYAPALAQYRRAAELAPTDLAPLLGMLMVAQATNDAQLRESTAARIRELDPDADVSAAIGHAEMVDVHSRARAPASDSPAADAR